MTSLFGGNPGLCLAQALTRMKEVLLMLNFWVACFTTFGQGTLNFANAGPGLQAKVTNSDGVGLVGSGWMADLYWAPGVVTDSKLLMALNQPAIFSTMPSQAGFFFGGPRTIPTAPGVITAQVRVWDNHCVGDGDCIPTQMGESILFQVTLADANAFPPGIPTTMTGLNGHPWSVDPVPEPSTLSLAILGAAAWLLFRGRVWSSVCSESLVNAMPRRPEARSALAKGFRASCCFLRRERRRDTRKRKVPPASVAQCTFFAEDYDNGRVALEPSPLILISADYRGWARAQTRWKNAGDSHEQTSRQNRRAPLLRRAEHEAFKHLGQMRDENRVRQGPVGFWEG